MRKAPAVLLAAVLSAPGVLLASPAGAVPAGVTITDCWKTQYGETVRIRIRDEGSSGRVRVSHHSARSVMRQPDVKRVTVGVRYSNALLAHGNDFSFHTNTSRPLEVVASFAVRNGSSKKIQMTCKMR